VKTRKREQNFEREIKCLDSLLALDRLRVEIRSQHRQLRCEAKRIARILLVWLKGNLPVLFIHQKMRCLIVGVRIVQHSRFLSLNRLGFGCVGSASAQTLVGPRRLVGASYHSTRSLFAGSNAEIQTKTLPDWRNWLTSTRSCSTSVVFF
jgi:hypothetical protein